MGNLGDRIGDAVPQYHVQMVYFLKSGKNVGQPLYKLTHCWVL
jgi:hypothetical protein